MPILTVCLSVPPRKQISNLFLEISERKQDRDIAVIHRGAEKGVDWTVAQLREVSPVRGSGFEASLAADRLIFNLSRSRYIPPNVTSLRQSGF